MAARGQSAMEYLMTYGWAILVVMVVGVALWRLGILNMGSSASPTSSGFQALKPLLASCGLNNNVPYVNPDYFGTCKGNGFYCQFLNNAGTTIKITNIDLKINDHYCDMMHVANKPIWKYGSTEGDFMYGEQWCWDNGMGGEDCYGATYFYDTYSWNNYDGLTLPKEAQFTLVASSPNDPDNCGWTPSTQYCYNFQKGQTYKIDIDITYDITIGKTTSQKHSVGTIRLGAT